ncbi:cold-shock protein [Candidatus Liberibacter africanus]|uniref:Cold shock protein n=1 Tax=Candidatus Liberibacter africanus PTSAPSY TaxID=1277257 RepID=A0A0G3I9P1_LIBAF|nr:cold-shock protein [Candidatus Liberibacter africanus]AKK20502.1 cold shock protein [Candidatus Liberibacter africanus PTSAPSY]QTP64215.1 cold-shock protein [Candidatus Liberibacter africanus]
MPKGLIKWYDGQKGYGFISPSVPGESDVFLHRSAVESAGLSNVREGQEVTYDFVKNEATGKYSAENIRLD